MTRPGAVLIDAISFFVSAVFLFRKAEERARREQSAQAGPGMKAELKEGLRCVFGNRYLRWIAASTATFNFFGNMIAAISSSSPSACSTSSGRDRARLRGLEHRLPRRRASRESPLEPLRRRADDRARRRGFDLTLLPARRADVDPIPFLIAAQAISGFGIAVYNITQVSFRQAITPERLQGRMNSVMRFIVWGVMPLGALLGGALATWFGVRFTIWVGAIGLSLAFLPVLLSPVRTLREMPEPVEEPLPSEADASGGLVAARGGNACPD